MKIIVFDLGGTLMEYVGMPECWADYYEQGFQYANEQSNVMVSAEELRWGIDYLKAMNPRINYREVEYTAEAMFQNILDEWKIEINVKDYIEAFFHAINLKVNIYADTIPNLMRLKNAGFKLAVFTDVPSAMPEQLYRKDLAGLMEYFDLYISSQTCGYRKPNPKALYDIAEYFKVNLSELYFIGDEEKDRKTAENAKCKFIHINRCDNKMSGEQMEIRTLNDIYKYLI